MKTITQIFSIFIFSIILLSCNTNKEKQNENTTKSPSETIIGQWKARWEISGEEVQDFPEYRKKMEGKMNFRDDGEVTITSFGFDECLIKTDTSVDVMRWKIDDGTLRIIDKKDVNGIPYSIQNFERNKIQLSLMDDIHLTLTR